MTRNLKCFLLIFSASAALLALSSAVPASAQKPASQPAFSGVDSTANHSLALDSHSSEVEEGGNSAGPAAMPKAQDDSPVAEVREKRLWELAPFVNGGKGVGNRADFKFLWAGFELGKPVTPVLHAGILTGQFELAGNIMPLWLAFTPAPGLQTRMCIGPTGATIPCIVLVGGGTYHGLSLTPVIFRWNFLTRSRRIQPWFQGAGGLIYTTHKFPPDVLVPPGIPGGTSVWNFSPQGGIGIHYFTRARRSIDLGVNAVHISSASLGDRNPGVNASIQIQLGYTFWK